MTECIRVAVIDDHPLFREGVGHLISSFDNCELVAQGGDYWDAIEIAKSHSPDVVLLDITLPGGGLNALNVISKDAKSVKTVMLTASESEADLSAALKAGASGFVVKGIGGKELIDIVTDVHHGNTYVEPSLASALILHQTANKRDEKNPAELLTHRELDILDSVAEAMTNKEIGRRYEITEKTVKHYMTNILQKLQVRNRVEAALVAGKYRNKL